MLLIYLKETGEIVGINTSPTATFENMYPDAADEFKKMYGGLVIEDDPDYDKNRKCYKVENGEVVKLDTPFIAEAEQEVLSNPKEQRIADLEMAVAFILGGGI
jgi:hypothetical protein